MDESRAIHQDIRPQRIMILNIMPVKHTTETHLLRLLSNTPLQIEIDLAGRRVRRQVSDFSSGRIRRLLEWQSEVGIPMMPINTVDGVAEQVRLNAMIGE